MIRTTLVLLAAIWSALAVAGAPAAGQELTPQEIFRSSERAVVTIGKTDLLGKAFRGTGFFVAPHLIATNHHVVNDARSLTIEDADGAFYTLRRTVAADPAADTAIIEVVERSANALRLEAVARPEVGETIYVIGNPLGYARTLSHGLVSGIRTRGDAPMYQISANVAQGSSGSPVINAQGEVVGIVFGRLPQEAQIAFATPSANLIALRDGGWRPLAAAQASRAKVSASRSLPPPPPAALSLGPEADAIDPRRMVRIGIPNWDSAIVAGHLLQAAIERLFPIQAIVVSAPNEDILAGIEASDRSYDIHPDVWLPNHRRFLTDHAHLSAARYVATQGICVPRYVLARFSVRSRTALANPSVARLFDTTGDGRGQIWIGEEGWQSTRIERIKARDHRYEQHFDLVTGSERDFYRGLDRLIAAQLPVAFYCYGPHWILRKHDLVVLNERPHSPSCYRLADDAAGSPWYDRSTAACGGPPVTVHRAYSRYIAEAHPELAAFLEAFAIDYEDLIALIFDMVGGERDNTAVAADWVERNAESLRAFMRAEGGR